MCVLSPCRIVRSELKPEVVLTTIIRVGVMVSFTTGEVRSSILATAELLVGKSYCATMLKCVTLGDHTSYSNVHLFLARDAGWPWRAFHDNNDSKLPMFS